MKKLMTAVALAVFALSGHAALQSRDLNHDGVTDAFYDTDREITWLRDANYALTSGTDNDGPMDGLMDWGHAKSWADSVTFGGYSDWRLPTTTTVCGGANCTTSEMGHLYYVELGNRYLPSSLNWGDFQNVQTYVNGLGASYWSETLSPFHSNSGTQKAWGFRMGTGGQYDGIVNPTYSNRAFHFAMLVRSGDVSPAPEPETYAMLLAGLGLIGAVARRRKSQEV